MPVARDGGTLPVYAVPADALADRSVLSRARRADRFSRMAILAAHDAVQDAGLRRADVESMGLLIATAFGPHQTTFGFLDGMLDFGETGVSPVLFSHSVHNAAAFYAASVVGSHGPTMTITRFLHSFHEALVVARAWMAEGRCQTVLLGAVDECGAVLEHAWTRKLARAADGRIRPFTFSDTPESVPGEGAVFFVLRNVETPKTYARIVGVQIGSDEADQGMADLYVMDADGLGGDESPYQTLSHAGTPTTSFTSLVGSMMTVSAFSCAIASLMLRDQIRFASPVPEGPCGVPVRNDSGPASLDRIDCVRFDCRGAMAAVRLQREPPVTTDDVRHTNEARG
jgi:3-oxoacyl-[acyl-carrier-protein] synthase II